MPSSRTPARQPAAVAPQAAYRLQLPRGRFDLHDVLPLIDYLDALGVSHVYLSPVFTARRGSSHGYDVVDPNKIDPALGGEEAFNALARALTEREMGILLDIVPNHMAASHENAWWWDVLRNGPDSPYAHVFDIDWEAGRGHVLLPVLGARYSEVLEAGELEVVCCGGRLELRYHDHHFPLRADTYEDMPGSLAQRARRLNGTPGDRRSFDALHGILDAQAYRLTYWRQASLEVSYRRFFDITDLVSVRTEDPDVFELTHQKVIELAGADKVTGLRIDHIDGLRDPQGYLERLRSRTDGTYIVVEKILDRGEHLPEDWPVAGTTGYEFANTLGGMSVDDHGARRLIDIGDRITGSQRSFSDVVYEKKQLVLSQLFGGEIHALARRLVELAAQDRYGRDVPSDELTDALRTVTATLDVYRTYIRDQRMSATDRERIEHNVDAARTRLRGGSAALDFVRRVLLLEEPPPSREGDWLTFVMRWQQLTGAATAKGFEDTSLYGYIRLVSRNEVGGDPGDPAVPVDEFHQMNALRLADWRGGLNTTSTHDTKRSEDVRARIDVLSEIPERWEKHLRRWRRWNPAPEPGPDPSEELLLYQTLVGAWPLDDNDLRGFTRRIGEYMVKAAREAKVSTSWHDPDGRHERALKRFVATVVSDERFLKDFAAFHAPVAFHGALNALTQVAGKIASPGVPDIYQGAELWHLFLVDPDNRSPVDFQARQRILAALADADPAELWSSWTDGRVKLLVTHRALTARKRTPSLYLDGKYLPLTAAGRKSGNVCAFARRHRSSWAIAVLPRLTTQVSGVGKPPLGDAWGRTVLRLPDRAPGSWTDVFTGETIEAGLRGLSLAKVLERFPVALLEAGRRTS